MAPDTVTVTGSVAPATFGVLDAAVMIAVPAAIPLICTDVFVEPASIVTLDGTVATEVALELRLMVRPPGGAGAERRRLVLCTPPAPTVTA
jgi:hypothetical protein